MIAQTLIGLLKTIGAGSVVFDSAPPDGFTYPAKPALTLEHISTTPAIPIDGAILGNEDRYQVSIRGSNVQAVREMAQTVIGALHGYQDETIKYCEFDSWPGTRRESSNPLVYFAPVDFVVHY